MIITTVTRYSQVNTALAWHYLSDKHVMRLNEHVHQNEWNTLSQDAVIEKNNSIPQNMEHLRLLPLRKSDIQNGTISNSHIFQWVLCFQEAARITRLQATRIRLHNVARICKKYLNKLGIRVNINFLVATQGSTVRWKWRLLRVD